MAETILVVEDDEALLSLIAAFLTKEKFKVIKAANGREGLRAFYDHHPDVVVLDVAMPVMDGFTLCRRIREVNEQTPLLMLTALNSEEDIIVGLEAGADEYICKPFRYGELLARIRAILRRRHAWGDKLEPPFAYQDDYLSIDLKARQVKLEGQLVPLTPIEYRLLALFVQNIGRVLTNRQILEQAWGWDYISDEDYPRVYIWHLRRKIEPDPRNPRYIVNEPGQGYRFVDHRTPAAQDTAEAARLPQPERREQANAASNR